MKDYACNSQSDQVNLAGFDGTANIYNTKIEMKIFKNPDEESVIINFPENLNFDLKIIDIDGNILFTEKYAHTNQIAVFSASF